VSFRDVADGNAGAPVPAVNKTRRLAQTIGTQVTLVMLGATASIVISHALGPQGRGAYYVVTTIATTAIVLGGLSLDQAQITMWTHAPHRRPVTGNSVLLGLAIGIAAAAAAGALVVGLGPGIVPITSDRLLAVALLAVPAGTTGIYVGNILTLRARMNVLNGGYLLGAVTQCVPLFILGICGQLSVAWVVIVWSIATGIPLAMLLPALRGSGGTPDLPVARRTVGLGLRYHAGTAAYFLLLRADVFILNALEPTTTAVGLYSLAVTLAELTKLLTESVVKVMMPSQVEAGAGRAAAITAATVRMSTLLSCGSVAAMCLTAPFLIPLLYGAQFRGAGVALLALAPGLLALGAARPISTYLLRLSRPVPMSMMFLAAMVVNVGLNLALIPRFGIVGASAASSVAYTLLAVVQVVWFVQVTRTRARDLLVGRGEVRLLRARLPQLVPARWHG
jgi:O-antigen/teichoic acid export membrane protein